MTGTSNSCVAKPGGNFFDFSISGDMSDCGTQYIANETHITYANAIQERLKIAKIFRKYVGNIRISFGQDIFV